MPVGAGLVAWRDPRTTLNDIFMNNVIVRLSQISEDVIRLFKKVGIWATWVFAPGWPW